MKKRLLRLIAVLVALGCVENANALTTHHCKGICKRKEGKLRVQGSTTDTVLKQITLIEGLNRTRIHLKDGLERFDLGGGDFERHSQHQPMHPLRTRCLDACQNKYGGNQRQLKRPTGCFAPAILQEMRSLEVITSILVSKCRFRFVTRCEILFGYSAVYSP